MKCSVDLTIRLSNTTAEATMSVYTEERVIVYRHSSQKSNNVQ